MSSDNHLQQTEAAPGSTIEPETETAERTETFSPTPETSPGDETGSASDQSSVATAVRKRLNPTVDESQVRAIPSLPGESARAPEGTRTAPPLSEHLSAATSDQHRESPDQETLAESGPTGTGEGPHAARGEERNQASSVETHRRSAPVDIPPVVTDLGAELEAEIAAAMASGELETALPAATRKMEEESAEAGEKPAEEALEQGQHFTGRIQSIHADSVFLDLGYRSPGVVPLRQFVSGKKPEVGQQIEVLVDRVAQDEGLIYLNLPKALRRVAGNWDSLSKGQIVDCLVNRTNKGGLEVTVSGLRGFLPSSQVDLGFVADLTPLVGQKLRVEVVEVNPKKRNLVVSRRAYLQIERAEQAEKIWLTLAVEQVHTGTVKTLKDYGAFVDLGGVDGFLHIGEMSWQRIKHPSEVVQEGQTIDVKVLSLDREKKKIGLGMKQLAQNPWTNAADRFPANSAVTGKVTRTADFGAFVELEPGLEGLIHVSELDHKRVRHPADVLKVHQVVTAQVLEVDTERKRISLSLKALIARPDAPKPEAEEPPPEPFQRKRKGPLKGGTGSSGPGGLFGNPVEFR